MYLCVRGIDFASSYDIDIGIGICINSLFGAWFMVFNATFNNFSVISCQSVLLVEETGVPGENHPSDKLVHIMLYRAYLV
jgi:hypothetical protein